MRDRDNSPGIKTIGPDGQPAPSIDAVVAGLICLDFTPVFDNPEGSQITEIFRPANTVIVKHAVLTPGGCVSNTGLTMCHFGAKTALIGKIGNDDFGDQVRKYVAQITSPEYFVNCDEGTAYTVVLAPRGIDRMFLHYPAGNDTFCADDIDYGLVSRAKLFHFGYPTIMKRMYENDGEELVRMMRRVKSLGVTTSLDSCGIDPLAPNGKLDWTLILERVVPHLDLFMPSAEELCFMLDKERLNDWRERAREADVCKVLTEEDVRPLAEKLLEFGAAVVCVKCGEKGMYFAAADSARMEKTGSALRDVLSGWKDVRHFEASYRPDCVLSAVGAGDVSIAAFLAQLLRGSDWRSCLRSAVAAGAACVESYSVHDELPSLAELDARIARGWIKNQI